LKKTALLIGSLLAASSCFASNHPTWSYSGEQGPENWAKLSTDYGACAGHNQSPVNLTGFIDADLQPITFNYQSAGHEILNNGHTVQINYDKGSSIVVDGKTFNLIQFHFHAPSENQINGKSFPLEAHLVHADKDGNLAVVAVMFEQGIDSSELSKAWRSMPQHAGDRKHLAAPINVEGFLPNNRDYYRFNGSLTTPPCTEGVRWLVMKQPLTASARQIEALTQVLEHPNNRPLQQTNARLILE